MGGRAGGLGESRVRLAVPTEHVMQRVGQQERLVETHRIKSTCRIKSTWCRVTCDFTWSWLSPRVQQLEDGLDLHHVVRAVVGDVVPENLFADHVEGEQ